MEEIHISGEDGEEWDLTNVRHALYTRGDSTWSWAHGADGLGSVFSLLVWRP